MTFNYPNYYRFFSYYIISVPPTVDYRPVDWDASDYMSMYNASRAAAVVAERVVVRASYS